MTSGRAHSYRDALIRRLNGLPDKWLPEVGVCFTITLSEKERAMLIKFLIDGSGGPRDEDSRRLDYLAKTLHIDGTGDQPVFALFIPGSEDMVNRTAYYAGASLRDLIDKSMAMVASDHLPSRATPNGVEP